MTKKVYLNNKSSVDYLWRGLGGDFHNFIQIISEFIDNSLSNYHNNKELYSKDNNMIINIDFSKPGKYLLKSENSVDYYSYYGLTISDNGTGIDKLDNALMIGGQTGKDSTLNEHGFGLKHAISAIDPNNSNWSIISQLINENHYDEIAHPYDNEHQPVIIGDEGVKYNNLDHGTIIKLKVSNEMIRTISRGVRGNYDSIEDLVPLLVEELGYIYGKILDDSCLQLNIRILDEDSNVNKFEVKSLVMPDYYEFKRSSDIYLPSRINNSQKGARLQARYICIDPDGNYQINKKHYRANSDSSGVEFRINDRFLCMVPFKDLWTLSQHPSYNGVIIIINIKSENANNLPKTTTNKTGFLLENNKVYEDITKWLTGHLVNMGQYARVKTRESLYFKAAKEYFQGNNPNNETYETEVRVFEKFGLKTAIDFYHHDNTKVKIYEGKLNKLKPENVNQLRMYWDGLIEKGQQIDEGILVSDEVDNSTIKYIKHINELKDGNGKYYNLSVINWDDFQPKDKTFTEYIKYLKHPNNIKYLQYDGISIDNYNNLSFEEWKKAYKKMNKS